MNRIGLGLITYNAPAKLSQSAPSVPNNLDHFVIVNDGTPYPPEVYPPQARIITHEQNRGVGPAKNTAIRALLDAGCTHLFLMEDDVLIKDSGVFQAYIQASESTGIAHFNFALQGSLNFRRYRLRLLESIRKRIPRIRHRGSRVDTTFDERHAYPSPRLIVEYPDHLRIALYPACVGAFSFFTREVIEQEGLMDERFINAGEHVDHTYRLIEAGKHPPFWWFADIADSWRYLQNIPECMKYSTISNTPQAEQWRRTSDLLWEKKHQIPVGAIPNVSRDEMLASLGQILAGVLTDGRDRTPIKMLRPWGGLVY